jgi:hypothetical protein
MKSLSEIKLRNACEEKNIALSQGKLDRVPMLQHRIEILKHIIHLEHELAHDDGKRELYLKHKIKLLEDELE